MPNIRGNIKPNTDKALTPLAYALDGIILTNHKGQTADIQNIVTDFSITESLYTASMILRLNIKDTANFIEEYQLIGQETIRVKMGRHDFTSPDWTDVDLTFYVTEYPIFGRGDQQNTQAYGIVAVSKQAYISAFKRISRAVKDTISSEIRRTLEQDLLVDSTRIANIETTIGRFNGVLPLMHPMDSCYWLLRRAYDESSRPFFLSESMRDGIRLESLTTLIDEKKNPVYRTYRDAKLFAETPGTAAYFIEQLERVLDVASDFKLSKVLPTISNGAYASRSTFLDLSTKTLRNQTFSYGSIDPKSTLNTHKVLSNTFGVPYSSDADIKDLSQTYDAFTEYLPVNSLAYSTDGSAQSYHDMMVNRLGTYNSIIETLDTITHEVLVAGDFNMRPGRKIALEIPKAIDLKAFDPRTLKGNSDDLFDRTVSGKYLVTAVIHQFDEEYHCRMRVKRDSFTFDVNKS
jgi:hypothetical protein